MSLHFHLEITPDFTHDPGVWTQDLPEPLFQKNQLRFCCKQQLTCAFSLARSYVSTVSYMDEPSQRDESSRLTVRVENTYQLGVFLCCLPPFAISHVVSDVCYLGADSLPGSRL